MRGTIESLRAHLALKKERYTVPLSGPTALLKPAGEVRRIQKGCTADKALVSADDHFSELSLTLFPGGDDCGNRGELAVCYCRLADESTADNSLACSRACAAASCTSGARRCPSFSSAFHSAAARVQSSAARSLSFIDSCTAANLP